MSKKHNRNFHVEEEFDGYNDRGYHDQLKERRKLKRMKNALKTRNIDDLMHLDDDGWNWINTVMPIYEFVNHKTGKTWEELCSMSRREEILQDPDITQVVTAPAIISGIAGVTHKNDSGFNDMLSRVAAANPHSPLAEKHGNKGIKESKVREAVKKVKKKYGSPLG